MNKINKIPYHKDSFHVSYSEYKKWKECQRKYKFDVIDGLDDFNGNEHTSFGTCVHEFCQDMLADRLNESHIMIDWYDKFEAMTNETDSFIQMTEKERQDWADQGLCIVESFWKNRKEKWDHLDFIKAEFELFTEIPTEICGNIFDDREMLNESDKNERFGKNPRFKGFIDVLMKDKEGNHYIIDLKTATKPWTKFKWNDENVTAQLKLYKHFYHLQEKVLYKNIKTLYYVMPRTHTENFWQIIEQDYSPASIKKELKQLSTFFSQTYDVKQFWPNLGSFYCNYCQYAGTKNCKEKIRSN